jgi:hypothetical protein
MKTIRPQYVEFIPGSLSEGVLYISERYRTAAHLCPCGCGEKVVTPLSSANWRLARKGDLVSLYPSIGNWSYACRSHYWIRDNKVIWSTQLSAAKISQVQEKDRIDRENQIVRQNRAKLAVVQYANQKSGQDAGQNSFWARLKVTLKRIF